MNRLLSLFFFIAVLSACSKTDDPPAQFAETRVIASGVNSAVVVNRLPAVAGVAAGTLWSAHSNTLTLENCDGHTSSRTGNDGSYTDSLTRLTYNTQYYIRAYASLGSGTVYGAVDSFYTLQTPYPPGKQITGGFVIAVDSSGMHGIMAGGSDLIASLPWSNYQILVGSTSAAFGSGAANTKAIVAAGNTEPQSAAAYCDNLVAYGYDDWFLPSFDELDFLSRNMQFGQYPAHWYWSSTEADATAANFVVLGGGASWNTDYKSRLAYVLPMRPF